MKRKEQNKRRQQIQKIDENRKRRKELMYLLKPLLLTFVVWFAVKSIISIPAVGDALAPVFVGFTAHATLLFGKMLFLPVELHKIPHLSVNGFTMEVIMECTAYTFYLFAVLLTVFARWPLKHKLVSLAVFLIVIFVMNKLRFIIMGYIGSVYPGLFDAIHDYLWNILFGFILFGLWLLSEYNLKESQIFHRDVQVP